MPRVAKAVKAITTLTAEERHQRLVHQNMKLKLEIAEKTKRLVPLERIKFEVLQANHTVKQQLLALPFRLAAQLAALSDPRDIHQVLERAITQCLNDLAYERDDASTAA